MKYPRYEPEPDADGFTDGRGLEPSDSLLCEKCDRYPRYERNGVTYKLCARCGWESIASLLELDKPDGEVTS